MPPAVIAAGIGAAGAIGGSLISGHAQTSAAQQATDATTAAQNQATQAQLQLGNSSLDLQRQMYNNNVGLQTDIYNQNYNLLSPFAGNGLVASNALNSLLGLPNAPHMTSQIHAPAPIASTGPVNSTGGTGGTGGTPMPGAGYGGPSLQQILAMQNDGVPGNYAANMQAYLASLNSQPQQSNAVVSQTPVNALAAPSRSLGLRTLQ